MSIHTSLLNTAFMPPWWLKNGLAMTVYTATWGGKNWSATTREPEPPYKETIFTGAGGVPIYGWVAIPDNPKSTIIGTYGITGSLDNQWFLRLLGRIAFAQGYAVVLFDWRAHGKTALLSPTLTSDGLYEGEDFVRIAAQAKTMGCPGKYWFTGFSLGGQLALWAVKASQDVISTAGGQGSRGESGYPVPKELGIGGREEHRGRGEISIPNPKSKIQNSLAPVPSTLNPDEIGGAAVICPSLDSIRSLSYLVKDPWGKYLEQVIARGLKQLAWQIYEAHPEAFDRAAIERANSIWGFDEELVIGRLGFPSVEAYYEASSGLHLLPNLEKPTLIIYAADDPLFDPTIVPDLQAQSDRNPNIDLILTRYGGHVGYLASQACQERMGDPNPWWAWNRVLEWIDSLA